MKKTVVLIIVFAVSTFLISCSWSNGGLFRDDPIETTSYSQTAENTEARITESPDASRETLLLAEEVLQLMEDENVSITTDYSSDIGVSEDDVYSFYKEQFPVIAELEFKQDAPRALLELYVEHIRFLTGYDYRTVCENLVKPLDDPDFKFRYDDPEGFSVLKKRDNLESLLALRVYFDRLSFEEKRLLALTLCERYNYCSEIEAEVLGSVFTFVFFRNNGEKLFDRIRFSLENDTKLSFYVVDN